MRRRSLSGTVLGAILWFSSGTCPALAQTPVDAETAARVDAAMTAAFATLYALPSDTDAVPLGEWVRDTERTAASADTGTWTIRITHLADTGQDLKLNEEMWKLGGATTARQIAESASAMLRIEGRISKADAEASLEVIVTINASEVTISGVSDDADRAKVTIDRAPVATRIRGDWMRVDDRELDVDYERWSPATLLIGFGPFGGLESKRMFAKESAATFTARARPVPGAHAIQTIAVSAQGSDAMLDRLLRETNWAALANLLN